MRRLALAVAALVVAVGCRRDDGAKRQGGAGGPAPGSQVASGSARAAAPVDAPRAPEHVADDAAWTDTTSQASMTVAARPTPGDPGQPPGPTAPSPAKTAAFPETTLEHPLPHGDAKDAAVAVARGDDAAAMIEQVLKDAGAVIPTDRPVVIKINAHGFDRMKPGKSDDGVTGRIVTPAFVRALIGVLRAHGVKDLAVADGGFVDAKDFAKLLALSGYQQVIDEAKVPFYDLDHWPDDHPPRRLRLPWAKYLKTELLVSSFLVDPDTRPFVIDVAKMKAHRFAVMTLSIKNLMGAVMLDGGGKEPGKRRWRMHAELSPWLDAWKKTHTDDRDRYQASLRALGERLADAYGAIDPELAIIEGMPPMMGDGFAKVVPYGDGGIVIASRNGCFADYVAAEYFGLADSDALEREIGFRMPPAIAVVAERYYGGTKVFADVKVVGDVDWLGKARPPAWFRAMAPFELNAPAAAKPAAE